MTKKDFIFLADVMIRARKLARDLYGKEESLGFVEGLLASSLKAKHPRFDVDEWYRYIDGEKK